MKALSATQATHLCSTANPPMSMDHSGLVRLILGVPISVHPRETRSTRRPGSPGPRSCAPASTPDVRMSRGAFIPRAHSYMGRDVPGFSGSIPATVGSEQSLCPFQTQVLSLRVVRRFSVFLANLSWSSVTIF